MSLNDDSSVSTKLLYTKIRSGSCSATKNCKKPNVVFITVDMNSPDCYVNSRPLSKVIKTPSLDLMATINN